jgi:hypothetical protein
MIEHNFESENQSKDNSKINETEGTSENLLKSYAKIQMQEEGLFFNLINGFSLKLKNFYLSRP